MDTKARQSASGLRSVLYLLVAIQMSPRGGYEQVFPKMDFVDALRL